MRCGCIMSLTSSPFRLSPRPSHAGYDPKKDMGYVEIHHCERQEFKKNCSSATHCCRRLAASGHDDVSLHSAKLDSLSSHLQLGRLRRRRGFVTKFSFQSSSGLQEAAKIGHLLVLEANDVASRNCLKYKRSVQSCIG